MTDINDRDKNLAGALTDVLATDDDEAFLERIMDRADTSGLLNTDRWWDVLDTWARPGMAVAAVAALIMLGVTLSANRPDRMLTSIAESLSDEVAATELAESAPPNPETMMASAFATD